MVPKYREKICSMRLDGATIYEIGDTVGMSKQAVAAFFVKTFPEFELSRTPKPVPDIPKARMMEICTMRIENQNLSMQDIANILEIPYSEVEQTFVYLRSRVPPRMQKSCYPAVNEWMVKNGVLLRELAEMVGVGSETLSVILRGAYERQMPYELATKLSEVTGLSFREIYALQIKRGTYKDPTAQTEGKSES